MYHRVCRIDPSGNVTVSMVMFCLDSFVLSDCSFWKCYIVNVFFKDIVSVHVLLRLLRPVRLNVVPRMFQKNGTRL